MSAENCCTGPHQDAGAPTRCPECGESGRPVEAITVKALLRPEALSRLGEAEHRFCATPSCPIVYFGHREAFDQTDVAAPVFQKEAAGARTVCYCFAVTETDLRGEIAQTGRSTAADEITAHVKAGRCACEIKNPRGSCCLGDVSTVVRQALAAVS